MGDAINCSFVWTHTVLILQLTTNYAFVVINIVWWLKSTQRKSKSYWETIVSFNQCGNSFRDKTPWIYLEGYLISDWKKTSVMLILFNKLAFKQHINTFCKHFKCIFLNETCWISFKMVLIYAELPKIQHQFRWLFGVIWLQTISWTNAEPDHRWI